jgi:ABC-type dipeptide/oligopeptide/nickel transport system permease component
MIQYALRRLLSAVPVFVGIVTIVFLVLQLLPGDPVSMMLGFSVTAESAARLRRELGLDDPLWQQYLRYWGRLFAGDLGRSMSMDIPVSRALASQFPATLQLTVAGLGCAVVFGVLLGVMSAVRHRTWWDTTTMVVALSGVSIPGFWLGLLLILVFAVHLNWVPITGQGGWERLILPAVAVGLRAAGLIARLTRSSVLEVLRDDYVTTARAKGLAERRVVFHHALRNAMIPVLTVVGLQFGQLMSGAVIIESVFAREGLGRLVVHGIMQRDILLVQGAALLLAVTYVLVNLAVDLAYAVFDPRIRMA